MFERLRKRLASGIAQPGAPVEADRTQDRVPPGQYVTPRLAVLSAGPTPRIELAEWRLRLDGLVERPTELTWEQFLAMPHVDSVTDFHCVTQWSRLNTPWGGVPASAILDLCGPKPEARYVMVHCYGGYTTNMPLDDLRAPDVLFAHRLDGGPLPPDHGGPMRLVVPALYGWKSAKWVKAVEFLAADRAGFWEERGYHMRGDPWREQRFG